MFGQKRFIVVFIGGGEVGEGSMSQTGKLKVWGIWEKRSGLSG